MPFVTRQVMPFGLRANRRRIQRKSIEFTDFNNLDFNDDDFKISFYTNRGTLLGYIFTGIKDTIVVNMVFTNDLRGCAAGYIELSELPSFPIEVYTEILIAWQGTPIYNGYVYKPMQEGSTKNQLFKFEFFGKRKKYETLPITLTTYSVQSITVSGSTSVFNITSGGDDFTIGSKMESSNCQNEANNGYFTITNKTATSVTVTNTAGIAQPTIGGSISNMPIEWASNVLVSEAFTQLVTYFNDLYGWTNYGLKYDPTLIEESTGLTVGGMRDHEGTTFQKAFETLEKLARGRYAMGVNESGYFFFKQIDTDVIRKFIMGYDLNKQALNTNYDNIVNVVNVNRSKGKSDSVLLQNGWITAASAFDSSSINKWGRKVKDITVPEFIDDDTAQAIADNELENSKDPKQFAKVENIKFDGLLEIGNYGIVAPYGEYKTTIDEMDALTGWVNTSMDSVVLDNDSVVGTSSIEFTSTTDGVAYKPYSPVIDARAAKRITLWVKSQSQGGFLRLKLNNNALFTIDVNIQTNDWFVVEWDVSDYGIIQVNRITVEFFGLTSAKTVFIDEISLISYGALHTILPYKQAVYNLKAHDRRVNLELGLQQDSLSEYLANVQNQIDTNNLLLKNRSASS